MEHVLVLHDIQVATKYHAVHRVSSLSKPKMFLQEIRKRNVQFRNIRHILSELFSYVVEQWKKTFLCVFLC